MKLVRIGSYRAVPIFVHWTVIVIGLLLLAIAMLESPLTGVAAMCSYLGFLLIHEFGHHYMAVRRNCPVLRVELYPFHGRCIFEEPESKRDHAAIALGGVLAQFYVAAPIVFLRLRFGYTHIPPIDAVIALVGFVSPAIAIFNLLPIAPLDGFFVWSALRLPRRRGNVSNSRPQTALEAMNEALRKATKK